MVRRSPNSDRTRGKNAASTTPESNTGTINYTEDDSGNLPHHVSPGQALSGDQKRRFGVKNYLHHFYEDCTGMTGSDEHEDYQMTEKPNKRCKLLCRIGFSVAIMCICIGIVLLLVGFLIPTKNTIYFTNGVSATNHDADLKFNEFLRYSRWAGAFLFCFGGILLSICIVIAGIGKINYQSELVERKIFEDRLQQGSSIERDATYNVTDEFGNLIRQGIGQGSGSPLLPATSPIPVSLREVKPIQPGAEAPP